MSPRRSKPPPHVQAKIEMQPRERLDNVDTQANATDHAERDLKDVSKISSEDDANNRTDANVNCSTCISVTKSEAESATSPPISIDDERQQDPNDER